MRRGEITFATLVGAIIAILVLVILAYILYNSARGFQKDVEECRGGYCAANCIVMTPAGPAGAPIGNDEWCEMGLWDLQPEQAEAYGDKNTRTGVTGSSLGLQCCQLLVDQKYVPVTYLAKNQRTGETDYISGITSPPRIQMYFAENPSPLGINSAIEAVSLREYPMQLRVQNVRWLGPQGLVAVTDGNPVPDAPKLECNVALLNEDGENLFGTLGFGYTTAFADVMGVLRDQLNKLCDLQNTDGKDEVHSPEDFKVMFPSILENQNFELVITLSEVKGQLTQPRFEAQAKYRIQVSDEIKITGLTNEWTKTLTLQARCVEDTCIKFEYGEVGSQDATQCKDATYDKVATVKNGVGTMLIDEEFPEGTYVCLRAQSATRVYQTMTDIPIRIDNVKPRVDVTYNPILNVMTIRCSEITEGSGCAIGAGIDEITGITEFFLGDCEDARYNWLPGKRDDSDPSASITQIEYKRVASVSRYCVEAQDRAGNKAYDTELAYDARTIAAATIAGWLASR